MGLWDLGVWLLTCRIPAARSRLQEKLSREKLPWLNGLGAPNTPSIKAVLSMLPAGEVAEACCKVARTADDAIEMSALLGTKSFLASLSHILAKAASLGWAKLVSKNTPACAQVMSPYKLN